MKNVRSSIIMALLIAIMLPVLGSFINVATLAQEVTETTTTTTPPQALNTSKAVNVTEVMLVKAKVLKDMLNRSLYLNISNELKNEIERLLNVNLSSLGIEQLKEWIRNASKVLADVAKELKEGKAFAVGIALQRYLNGLRIALENRVKTLARKYNISVEELKEKIESILANASKAPDVNRMFKELNKQLRNITVARVKEFVEKAKEYTYNFTEKVRGGEARGLDVAIKHIEKAIEILNRTLDKLRSVNASQQAIEAIENSIERLKTVKDVLEGVAEEIGEVVKPQPEKVRVAFNVTLKMLINKANHSIDELLEELKNLRERATNYTEILIKIDELEKQLLNMKEELKNVENISEVKEILEKVSEARLKIMTLCKEIDKLTENLVAKVKDKVKEIAEDLIKKAEKKLEDVRDLYNKVKEEVSKIFCIQIFPPPPGCVAIENIKKMLPFIEKEIDEAEQDIINANKSYEEGDYVKAMVNAQKALARLTAVENQLRIYENILKISEKGVSQQPSGQQGTQQGKGK